MGLNGTLNQLFSPPQLPPPPVNHYFTSDPNVPVGQTWVNSPHVNGVDVNQYRTPSMKGWYFLTTWDGPFQIMDKLAMFWVNHFGMSDIGEQRAQYQYITLFREHGAGSFQSMIEKITVLPAMLKFLNGEYSNMYAPNENYARELLELFTLQKGPQIAPGDYTHYTETDITEIARIMTGYRNRGMWSTANVPVESYWDQSWHDTGTKQLSYHFNNAVILNNDEDEYKDVIAVIFQQPEVSKAICREFYRYFCYYEIDATIETTVIEPLASFMRTNNYDVEATLRNLFASDHFYEMAIRGPIIKSPYEFMFSMVRPMGAYGHLGLSIANATPGNNLQTTYDLGSAYHWWMGTLDMDVFFPPTVAGWKAYYQSPGYYRNWIGSATLKRRRQLVNNLTGWGFWSRTDGDSNNYQPRPFDWMGFIDSLDNPWDVNVMLDEIIDIFLPRPIEPSQFDALKAQLLPNLPDSEWQVQYANYDANRNDPMTVTAITNKVKDLFLGLFSMAEFHLT